MKAIDISNDSVQRKRGQQHLRIYKLVRKGIKVFMNFDFTLLFFILLK